MKTSPSAEGGKRGCGHHGGGKGRGEDPGSEGGRGGFRPASHPVGLPKRPSKALVNFSKPPALSVPRVLGGGGRRGEEGECVLERGGKVRGGRLLAARGWFQSLPRRPYFPPSLTHQLGGGAASSKPAPPSPRLSSPACSSLLLSRRASNPSPPSPLRPLLCPPVGPSWKRTPRRAAAGRGRKALGQTAPPGESGVPSFRPRMSRPRWK